MVANDLYPILPVKMRFLAVNNRHRLNQSISCHFAILVPIGIVQN